MILYMLRDEVWDGAHCEFFQFSQGVRVIYDQQNHILIYKIGLQYYFYLNMEDFFSVICFLHELSPLQMEKYDRYRSCQTNLIGVKMGVFSFWG